MDKAPGSADAKVQSSFASPTSARANEDALLASITVALSPIWQEIPGSLRHTGNWLTQVMHRMGTEPMLRTSIRALAKLHLGYLMKDQGPMQQSRVDYAKALMQLQTSLSGRHNASNVQSTAMILTYYEVCRDCENRAVRLTTLQLLASAVLGETQAWVRHAGGVALVMKLRGPSAFESAFDHAMFMAARSQMV